MIMESLFDGCDNFEPMKVVIGFDFTQAYNRKEDGDN